MKKRGLTIGLVVLGLCAALLFGLAAALTPVALEREAQEQEDMLARLLPESESFAPEPTADAEFVTDAWKGETGFVVETTTQGYAGKVVLLVGVDTSGKVTGLVVRDMEETYGLGGNALWDVGFLSQFLHTAGENEVGVNVDALTGATVTTKAIVKGVNAASAFVTGAEVDSGATQWEG